MKSQNKPEPVIEPATIQRLADLGGGKLLRQLVELFEAAAPPRVAAIVEGQQAGDAEAVEREAHALKASAGNLGAVRVQVLCQHIENEGNGGDVTGLGPVAALLEEELGLVMPRLRSQVEALES